MSQGHIPPRPIPAPAAAPRAVFTGGEHLTPREARERVLGELPKAQLPETLRAQLALVERWAIAAGGAPKWLIDPDQTGEMLVSNDTAARVHWRCAQELLQACAVHSGTSAAELLANVGAAARTDCAMSADEVLLEEIRALRRELAALRANLSLGSETLVVRLPESPQ